MERDVDTSNSGRGVWLVKVPKYIDTAWSKCSPMSEVGRLKIGKGPGGKPDIHFTLSSEVVLKEEGGAGSDKASLPREHKFVVSAVTNQTMAVFSQGKATELDELNSKITLEGTVAQKGECRPICDDNYLRLKKQKISMISQPVRQVKHLDKIVQNYKPISNHKMNIEFEQRKKTEGKKSRENKDKVQEMLFAAFEKHQYYNIKDLERITRQPIPYLKENLKEICNYNAKNPHKNMWELKPEYRHYKDSD